MVVVSVKEDDASTTRDVRPYGSQSGCFPGDHARARAAVHPTQPCERVEPRGPRCGRAAAAIL